MFRGDAIAGLLIVFINVIGGMSAWKEQPAIPQALATAAQRLRDEGDTRVWTYTFQAFTWAHPRIDTHELMADELVAFLKEKVLP